VFHEIFRDGNNPVKPNHNQKLQHNLRGKKVNLYFDLITCLKTMIMNDDVALPRWARAWARRKRKDLETGKMIFFN